MTSAALSQAGKERSVPEASFPAIAGANVEVMEAVRSAALGVTEKFDRAYFLQCAKDRRHPGELMKALADAELLGIGLPEELGGSGGGLTEEFVLTETLARAGIILDALLITNFCRHVITKVGSDEQKAEFIPGTVAGELTTAFAITEANSGTNAFAMRTTATEDGDIWVINGEKIFTTHAVGADKMFLVARSGTAENGKAELSMFLIDLPAKGMTATPMGISVAAPSVEYIVHFDDMKLPRSALIGARGDGIRNVFHALNGERVLAAAVAVGLGARVVDVGAQYARIRAPFGKVIGGYQAVSHPLAKARVYLDAARILAYEAALASDQGLDPSGIKANTAKYVASEAAFMGIDATMQVYGGAAFDPETDLLPYFNFLRFMRIAPINNEMILNSVAEKRLGLPRSY